jgi:putative transposase
MAGLQPPAIELSTRQQTLLEQLKRAPTNPHRLVQRASLILHMATPANNQQTARHEGCHRETVQLWRARWLAAGPRLSAAETNGCTDKQLSALITQVLDDEARPGAPATFSAEQLTQLVAIACADPADSGRPISHWTARELADELVKRKVVRSISTRHVGRFLKSAGVAAAPKPVLVES